MENDQVRELTSRRKSNHRLCLQETKIDSKVILGLRGHYHLREAVCTHKDIEVPDDP
jgi:hypothetical protein